MTPKQIHNQNVAMRVVENFQKRGIDAQYVSTKEEALEALLALIPKNSVIGYGGSMTLAECGVLDALKEGDYRLLVRENAKTPEEQKALYREMLFCDYFLTSANAITEEGEIVNIDGRGNRVAFLTWGPEHVVILAGINKVTPDLESAIHRAKNVAAPKNALRLERKTPCTKLGKCADCQSPDCICATTVITRRSHIPGRIRVLLVGEELGY